MSRVLISKPEHLHLYYQISELICKTNQKPKYHELGERHND